MKIKKILIKTGSMVGKCILLSLPLGCIHNPSEEKEEKAFISALQPNTTWTICKNSNVPRVSSMLDTFEMKTNSDTAIYGTKYVLVEGTVDTVYQRLFLEETSGKIYQYLHGSQKLIYDIGLSLYDTCLGMQVYAVDTLSNTGIARKRVRLSSSTGAREWIEGVCPIMELFGYNQFFVGSRDSIVFYVLGGPSYFVSEINIDNQTVYKP